jgi:hypothetical protein
MPFSRTLAPAFIAALNDLYRQGTWWTKLADATDVFLGVRRNCINAYAGGGSIGKITWDGKKVGLIVHEEYLTLPSRDCYVDLTKDMAGRQRQLITTLDSFEKFLPQIRRRAEWFSGNERRGENCVACKLVSVIDMEAAFEERSEAENLELELESDSERGRVDLVALSSEGRLIFIEAKLYSNSDLRSTTVPAVCGQLTQYHTWLKKKSLEICTAYTSLVGYHQELTGGFFERKRVALILARNKALSVDPIPRLIVFGFGAKQSKGLLADLRQQVEAGVAIEGFQGRLHVQAVGNVQSIREHHLQ